MFLQSFVQQSNIKRAKSNNAVIWQTWIRLPVYVSARRKSSSYLWHCLQLVLKYIIYFFKCVGGSLWAARIQMKYVRLLILNSIHRNWNIFFLKREKKTVFLLRKLGTGTSDLIISVRHIWSKSGGLYLESEWISFAEIDWNHFVCEQKFIFNIYFRALDYIKQQFHDDDYDE